MDHVSSRRSVVLGGAGLVGLVGWCSAIRGLRAEDATDTTEILEPFGGQTVANVTKTLSSALEHETNRTIKLTPVSDDGGAAGTIIEKLNAAPADGSLLGVLALLSSAMTALHDDKATLSSLTPIAQLTRGWSEALFTASASPIRSWQEFVAVASRGTLKVASFDQSTVSYLGVQMIKRYTRLTLDSVVTRSPMETMQVVQSGTVAAGVLPIPSLMSMGGQVRPLVTFGAQRNPVLGFAPTLSELVRASDAELTENVAVFAPPATPPEIADRWTQAFIAAAKGAARNPDPGSRYIELAVEGPAVLRATMERNAQLLRRVFPS
ncbi:MAG TPA: tripartite tricarboxylate transporter substrate-binding protein [Stellaceae bacterium]|jgi:tripartite-type tricarboxylate transporter receptor subunit TctC|nr:tripartite tricarboxylate transporter substrate-binding protein [Stellaceae bacterium]